MKSVRRSSLPSMLQIQPVVYIKNETKTITQVNQYLMLKKIGRGASSKIFIALDVETGKHYAIKKFKPTCLCAEHSPFAHFEREIRILSRFHHENILSIHEALFSQSSMTAYLVLELANCGSLDQFTQKGRALELSEIATIFSQVIKGIVHLHKTGIAHKDIKPSNILLFSDGSCKISDFGIGHSFQSADSVVGTPAYQAPEVFGDDETEPDNDVIIDPIKEDVWSMGVSIYQIAFGRLPFLGGNEFEIARSARESILQYDANVPSDLIDLLQGMLNIDPEKRFDMEQVAAHKFFKRAKPKIELKFQQIHIPHMKENTKIRFVDAISCADCIPFIKMTFAPISNALAIPPRALSRA